VPDADDAPATAAGDGTPAVAPKASSGGGDTEERSFASSTTPGFDAHLQSDGSVRLSWRGDSGAEGYNVYRQGKYHATVRGMRSWIDREVSEGGTYRYAIHSFTSGQNKRFRKIAGGLTVRVPSAEGGSPVGANGGAAVSDADGDLRSEGSSNEGARRDFTSATTRDFTARILDDGSVRLAWGRVASAGGYNVYRQGKYHATVHAESYVDVKLARGDYRYEIHAFSRTEPRSFWKIAGDLTVKVRGEGSAPPPLAAAAPPAVAPKLTPEPLAPAVDASSPESGSGGSDDVEQAPLAIDGSRPSPGHRPSLELWPGAHPERP